VVDPGGRAKDIWAYWFIVAIYIESKSCRQRVEMYKVCPCCSKLFERANSVCQEHKEPIEQDWSLAFP